MIKDSIVLFENKTVFELKNQEINNSENDLKKCTSLSIKQREIFNKVTKALGDEQNSSWR